MFKPLRAAIFVAAFTLSAPAVVVAQGFDAPQTQAIEKIVRDYLIKNPEILLEVNDALQKKMQEKLAEQRTPVLKSLYSKETPYSAGKGDVTVVEFFDYNCPNCRTALNDIVKLMESDKSVRVIFIDMPIFPDSPGLHKISLAAAKQGKYFEFHQALMAQKGRLSEADALKVAKEIGLDADKLKADAASPEIETVMADNLKLADSLGVNGTPAFFIGDTEIAGAPQDPSQLTEAVAETRKNGCNACDDKKKS